jgi:ABC-type sulfate transport system substrate-binding protein
MRYLVTTLPADPSVRARRIAHERAQGGTLYTRPDGSVVIVRASWPFPSSSLVTLDAILGDWTEITA